MKQKRWENIIKAIEEKNIKYDTWSEGYMSFDNDICGITIENPELSIISHNYSYGGKQGLFEIMPGLDGEDVTGYLKEEDIINIIKEYR